MRDRNDTIRKAVAVRLRETRESAGLTPSDLASRSGMALGNYYLLERGEGNPTVSTLVKIAEGLDTDPGELLRGLRR